MISIRTGLGVMFSPSVVVFCWDRINTVQSTPHTTSGTKRGNKVVSDCCMKIATTPISPNTNPSPLRIGNEALSSVLRFSIIRDGCTSIYDSMFIHTHYFRNYIQALSSPVSLMKRRTTTPMTIKLIPMIPAVSIF